VNDQWDERNDAHAALSTITTLGRILFQFTQNKREKLKKKKRKTNEEEIEGQEVD